MQLWVKIRGQMHSIKFASESRRLNEIDNSSARAWELFLFSNYHSFDKCLNNCDDVVRSDMQKGMEGLNVLCQQKKSGKKVIMTSCKIAIIQHNWFHLEYLQHLPCLVTSRMNMMVECGQQNQQLTKSTKDLTNGLQNFLMQSDGQILGLLKKYCKWGCSPSA